MKLTLHTDYALRMMIFLAVRRDRPATVSDVAATYGLSRNHLLKVARNLGRLGYIRTVRGRSGGIALARSPEDVNLGEVVRRVEDGFALVECLQAAGGACALSPACKLKGVVKTALEAFLQVFDRFTLADIASDREAIAALLDLHQGAGKTA